MAQRKKRLLWIAIPILLGMVVLCVIAFDIRLTVRTYQIESAKLTGPVRVALITDLHSCDYGKGQRELLDAVEAQSPDVVLLGGDIADDKARSNERAYEAVRALAARWPTYYVSGNHEFWSGDGEAIFAALTDCGAVVLRGESVTLDVAGQTLFLSGIDDPYLDEAEWRRQLDAVTAARDDGHLSILLTHRPERVEDYRAAGFDLTLAGHAHGGQWAIPGLLNGLLAPNQGLFPKYAGGCYDLETTMLVVSRGLARESTRVPRIFNPPELVILALGKL